MIALLAMAAVFVFKWLLARKAGGAPSASPMQYAGAGGSNPPPQQPVAAPQFGATAATSAPAAAVRVPEGFDSEGFLRIAKVNFVRLQAANDAKNMDDIRQFVAPEMFAEFQMEMSERGNAPQQTDVVTLNAELLEVVTEGNRHVASVHFSGMIREVVGAAAVPFNEVWNLAKPVSGDKGWVIAGIQQLS
jgi:predicted lipid-binding transport protein (Tim44 family)